MSSSIKRIYVVGFPGLYGGAGTELHHQIIAWRHMGTEVHLIPTGGGVHHEPLYLEMIERGVIIHEEKEWSAIEAGDPVLGFCNAEFLNNLREIRQRSRRIVFVNCMTWLFPKEREAMSEGLISMFLYQNEWVRQKNMPELKALNGDPVIQFLTFAPYFYNDAFPMIEEHSDEFFGCGRISRQDADKFAKNTLHIYEYFVSPKMKKGFFLGFDERSQAKVGKPHGWITTYRNQRELSQQDFYKNCEIVLQPTDTTENWPRIGLESMSSGSVLIVDNRGGWKSMVEHGKTGWLCDHERDFIYYASKMAYEPGQRADMAAAARERVEKISGLAASVASWERIFEEIAKLPA